MRIHLILLILMLIGTSLDAAVKTKASKHIKVNKKICIGINKKIETINSLLRVGYSLKKGEVLKAKLRKLEKQKYTCSRKRYPTQ